MPLVQQRDNVIIVNATNILRNSSEIKSTTDWRNSDPTFSPFNNDKNSTYSDVNVKTILNTNHNHHLRKGAGIRDSLPGIKNKFG